jgi:hypothetical protein
LILAGLDFWPLVAGVPAKTAAGHVPAVYSSPRSSEADQTQPKRIDCAEAFALGLWKLRVMVVV